MQAEDFLGVEPDEDVQNRTADDVVDSFSLQENMKVPRKPLIVLKKGPARGSAEP